MSRPPPAGGGCHRQQKALYVHSGNRTWLNLSIQAVPREGAGRTIQLVVTCAEPEKKPVRGKRPRLTIPACNHQPGRPWRKITRRLVQVPVTKETLQAPAGLSSVAEPYGRGIT